MKKNCIIFFCIFLIFSCGFQQDISKKRSAYARSNNEVFLIGVAWPFILHKDLVYEGIAMAIDEINEKGGILTKKIELVKEDDNEDVSKGLVIAENFSENPRMMAVIGHCNSFISMAVALTYETNKLIMFSPASTNPDLTKNGYNYILRNVPTDEVIGMKAADLCNQKVYKSICICYGDNEYGLGLANSFEKGILDYDINIVNRSSFNTGSPNEFDYIVSKLSVYSFDAIFFADSIVPALTFITRLRDKGYTQPIIGGDGLDSMELLKLDKKYTNNVFIVSYYNPYAIRESSIVFSENFFKKYKHEPDIWAAQGYDAMMIIAEGMKRVKSIDPIKVSPEIKKIKNWIGATGKESFNESGDVTDKTLVLKYSYDGQFKYLDFE